MQIICISRGTLSGGRELAERVAKKLGCACLSRERLIEAATDEGIQVGKLEMAVINPRGFSERLAVDREYYRAFSTAYLCDQALEEGRLIYHGRMGHLLLPGIDHVLRVRVVADREQRIWRAARELRLDAAKARKYVEEVDEDRQRWARAMYGVGWEDAAHYDLVANLERMSVENAASALTAVAQLPDFQMTPASQKTMMDLRLAATSRVFLARHERTCKAKFKVQANDDVVTVTYLPQDSRYAEFIPEVLAPVAGISTVRTTMATTNILWIQERFDSTSDTFHEVVELATKWNAAVELLRLVPKDAEQTELPDQSLFEPEPPASSQYNGGIEDDVDEAAADDGGVKNTLDELAAAGRSGGSRAICGETRDLLDSLVGARSYSLVIIGDLFLKAGHAAKLRMTRELQRVVGDHIAAPVVGTDELKAQYLFGLRDVGRLAAFLSVVGVLYALVFFNQETIVRFQFGQWWGARLSILIAEISVAKILVAVAVFVFVPVIAHSYGTVAKSLMKLIKME